MSWPREMPCFYFNLSRTSSLTAESIIVYLYYNIISHLSIIINPRQYHTVLPHTTALHRSIINRPLLLRLLVQRCQLCPSDYSLLGLTTVDADSRLNTHLEGLFRVVGEVDLELRQLPTYGLLHFLHGVYIVVSIDIPIVKDVMVLQDLLYALHDICR